MTDDRFDDTAGAGKVVLAHSAKNRIAAEAPATLQRGDFIARVHVPFRGVRQRKNVVRQRRWLARVGAIIRHRIHRAATIQSAEDRALARTPKRRPPAGGRRSHRSVFACSRTLASG